MKVIDSSALVKYFAREEGWERVRELILEGVITLDLAIKEVVTPSPHPQEALRLPRAVCRFSARMRTPHPSIGFPILGASPFRAGGPRPRWDHRTSFPHRAPLHLRL